MTNPLRILNVNLIDTAVVTASSAIASLPASHLQTEDIRELWRSTSTTPFIVADFGSVKTIGVAALMETSLGLADSVQVRLSTSDATGAAGDAYNSGTDSANVDPVNAMLVHPIEPSASGRYLRFDMQGSEAVEAGRWIAGPVFSPSRDRAFGAEEIWRDPSRRIESLGQATLIDRKRRQRGLRFTLRGLTVAEADQLRAINRTNGTSQDILVVTDVGSSDLGSASIWGLLETPIRYSQNERNFIEAEWEVWERL